MFLPKKIAWIIFFLTFFLLVTSVAAEEKPPGQMIFPKLPKTPNDPVLSSGGVYPQWGPVCQRYTYHTTYSDKEGRPPEYVRLWLNGQWIESEKEKPTDNDYKKGVRYVYKYVPNKLASNFFFFEASNGLGKTREGIIDSPGNGPVLFEGDFLDNETAVIDSQTGEKILKYPTSKEWVGGVALSDDGRWLAAKTSFKILLFDLSDNPKVKPEKPVWEFSLGEGTMVGGDVKGGVDISGDGSKIVASIGDMVLLFNKSSNEPIWSYPAGNAYNVAISRDGNYLAVATAGEESNPNTNLIILWKASSSQPIWQYHASGNFHYVSLSDDGSFLAGATGCPDRRAYIFSRDSKVPLVKSEMLTYDSPVSRAKITADGTLAAFNTDGGPNSSLVALFSKDSSQPLWKFTDPSYRASRALAITPDGKFIAVANMNGDVYLFGKEGSQPLKTWQINATTGTLDLADDGSFVAAGGTDNKVHLLEVASGKDTEVVFDEYVEEIDISANSKYVAVGTGGSPYFFESIKTADINKVFPCPTIIEPPSMDLAFQGGQFTGGGQTGFQGPASVQEKKLYKLFLIYITFKRLEKFWLLGWGIAVLTSAIYLVIVKFNLLRKPPETQLRLNKRIIILLSIFATLCLILSVTPLLLKKFPQFSQIDFYYQMQKGGQTQPEGEQNRPSPRQSSAVCGNNICEPDFDESKESCPKDCSAED